MQGPEYFEKRRFAQRKLKIKISCLWTCWSAKHWYYYHNDDDDDDHDVGDDDEVIQTGTF